MNRLRNVAQNNTQAEYIFLIDVDFIPNKALEFYIDQHIERGFYDSEKVCILICSTCGSIIGKENRIFADIFQNVITVPNRRNKYVQVNWHKAEE